MMRTCNRLLLIGCVLAGAGLTAATAQDKATLATYKNDKHGFSLTYPTGQFLGFPTATPDGFQAVSRDGKARLLVGTLANYDAKSLGEYRTFILNESYPGANVTYAPVRETWFVVSGIKNDGVTGFYQRVNFVCGGRNINSWTVLYPYGEKPAYSPIIEQVHKDYRLGDGNCGKMTATQPGKGTK